MLRRFIPKYQRKTLLFSWLPTNYRSFTLTSDYSDACSSTQLIDISKFNKTKKSHRISVNNIVINSRNISKPLHKPIKLNHKLFTPEMPTECCNNQCDCCVWILYIKEIENFYNGDKDKIEEALNHISNTETRNYVRENYNSFV